MCGKAVSTGGVRRRERSGQWRLWWSSIGARRFLALLAVLVTTTVAITKVHAGVLISGTRFVYPAAEKEITLTLSNRGEFPVLVKAWIDEGDPKKSAEVLKPPFLLTPPLARVEPKGDQAYRLHYTGSADQLPKDRESLFWINLLDVPPTTNAKDASGSDQIQFAFQYRIKLFYRPTDLRGSPAQAAHDLQWSMEPAGKRIAANNDTPYHVSLGKLALKYGSETIELTPATIAPFSVTSFELPESAVAAKADASVSYEWINEWGGLATEERTLNRTP